ncbi:MAG: hypothetical protein U0350_36435 [Caldilineaceae bacterium]
MNAQNSRANPQGGIKLRIISDGTPFGLQIVDCETGARLWGVQSMIVQARTGEAPTAIIRVANVELDLTTAPDVVIPAKVEGASSGE